MILCFLSTDQETEVQKGKVNFFQLVRARDGFVDFFLGLPGLKNNNNKTNKQTNAKFSVSGDKWYKLNADHRFILL